MGNGLVKMDRAFQVPKDETKRRKTNEHPHKNTEQRNQEEAGSGNDARSGSRTEIQFSKTELGGLPGELVTHLRSEEEKMIVSDKHEVARQEAKNSWRRTFTSTGLSCLSQRRALRRRRTQR